MTSISLFPPVEHKPSEPKEWGSGKLKKDVNVFVEGPPTWHQSQGLPVEQFYNLTQLKLSNVRSNDELLPEPQHTDMGRLLINKTFPAEHPYSSHIPRTAMFPTFDSPEDSKRGVNARLQQPINAEMPATAYNVQIVHKTKGFGDRREIQDLPKESEKKGLKWQGEEGFNQLAKVHGGRQQYYPVPPKVVAPNLQHRWPEMQVTLRTANANRNVEREQWQTTYDLNHTGLGPSNPKKLDNLGDKSHTMDVYGIGDDNLYPRSVNTFDPPRPYEGRIARTLTARPNPMPTAAAANAPENPNYQRMMTLSEREEHRLLHGKDYLSFPEDRDEHFGKKWKELEETAHPHPNLKTLEEAKEEQPADEIPYKKVGAPPEEEDGYLTTTKEQQDKRVQQMEAQNRWKVLEAHSPGHDISSLNYKMGHVHEEEKPSTFYGHEGKYNEERAGLYKTSYSPERLAYSMNALDVSGPEIMNNFNSHVDALNLQTPLNYDVAYALQRSHTLPSVNLSGDRRTGQQVMNQVNALKEVQKKELQPNVETAQVKVQEKETVLKESTMGDSYNVEKFLQERNLPKFARKEPLHVMSSENQNLNNVRMNSTLKPKRSVTFSDNVSVATLSENGPLRFSSAPTRGLTMSERQTLSQAQSNPQINTTQYVSTHALYSKENEFENPQARFSVFNIQPKEKETNMKGMQAKPQSTLAVPTTSKRPVGAAVTEYKNQFCSLDSNFIPRLQHSMSFASAYQNQFPSYHIGYKDDPRFSWEPGMGIPRPQTSLLGIQNSFVKTEVRKKFLGQFSESNPDLRENITSGKKHNFYGMSGQLIHG